eukprot:scpid67050/ scgid5343/ Phosphatidylcholine-sterol acyltransferase; Lecithin-cholesterol acyltransferase; Phospholipid-cholesterol acyltransferase
MITMHVTVHVHIAVAVLLVSTMTGYSAPTAANVVRPPIILVPGLAGSQLDGKQAKDFKTEEHCLRLKDWGQVWLALDQLAGLFANCATNNLRLDFDPMSLEYSEPEGMQIRVPHFGSTASVEYLDRDPLVKLIPESHYLHAMVNFFVKEHGYTRDVDIVAAPYDWRKSPWGKSDTYFDDVQHLIEQVSNRSESPAIVISHSMGGPVMQAFFNQTTSDWKDEYISAWFPVDGVWTGSPKVAKAIISGENFGAPAPESILATMERTLESSFFLMPLPDLWPENVANFVTVEGSNKTIYGTGNTVQLLADIGVPHPDKRLDYLNEMRMSLEAPGVPVHCVYGTGVATAWHYTYKKLDGSPPAHVEYGDGDGTVPLHSLARCADWADQQNQSVTVKTFFKLEHDAAIKSQAVFKYIQSQIPALASPPQPVVSSGTPLSFISAQSLTFLLTSLHCGLLHAYFSL